METGSSTGKTDQNPSPSPEELARLAAQLDEIKNQTERRTEQIERNQERPPNDGEAPETIEEPELDILPGSSGTNPFNSRN